MGARARSSIIVTCVSVLASATAAAEQHAPASVVIGGLGGVTFSGSVDSAAAGRAGVQLGQHVAVLGEVGQMRNIIPQARRDAIERLISDQFGGQPAKVDSVYRARYGLVGARISGRQVFVEAGAGRTSIRRTPLRSVLVNEQNVTDIARAFTTMTSSTGRNALFVAGGGMAKRINPGVTFDAGYRLTRIPRTTEVEPAINASLIYVGLTVGRADH